MTRGAWALLVGALAMVAAVPTEAPRPLAVAAGGSPGGRTSAPEGCYDVEVGMWRAVTDRDVTVPRLPPDASADSTDYVMPPRIRLSETNARMPEALASWLHVETPEGTLPTGHRFQTWKLDGDRLLLAFSTGLAGVNVVLTGWPAGVFVGVARTFDDVGGTQRYERAVSLHPVDCATPPPHGDTELNTLPRTVELEGGVRLTLGEPAPRNLPTRPRPSGAVGVTARSAGLFAGSDSVAFSIGRDDGKVGAIQLIFPAPASADSLIARITRTFGPPDPHTSVPGGWWHNRITELSVIPSRGQGGGFRVLFQDPRIR